MDPPTSSPVYRYEPLSSTTEEIRLVHLLPALDFLEPIRLQLVHVPFSRPQTSHLEQGRYAQLFESLAGEFSFPWCLEETTQGELIAFNVVNGETYLLDQEILGLVASGRPSKLDEFEPRYEALSYTWGEAGISESAVIEVGDGPVHKLGIRQNLASALRHFRHHSETRVLWIDAICINQDDVDERNQQVKRMTDIYTLASRVVAWLGDEQDRSDHALGTLRHVGTQLRSTKSGRVISAPDATERRLWRNDTPPSFTQDDWQAVMAFVERPWFYRIWCWQEIKLGARGATLQCGQATISWRQFWLAILCLHNKDTSPSRHFRERCRHIVFLQYEGESIVNLLDTARSKGCADPRDKIYGLLGITPLYFRSRLTVDYHRPPEQVYKDAFMAHLHATQRLDLLKHCNLSTHGIGGPSWVPDWSRTEFAAPILSEQLSAGISRAWFTYHDQNPEALDVVGIQYTTIKIVSTGVASKVEDETLLIVKEWHEQLPPRGDTAYLDTQTAFILTLCMNRTMERHPDNHFLSVDRWVSMLHSILQLDPQRRDDPLYQKREIANLVQKIRGRVFIVSESGHFGTAPAGTMVGK